MTKEELRIGNIVWNDYSGLMIVSSIISGEHNSFVDLIKNIDLPSGRYSIEDIKGVTLTEAEILNLSFSDKTYKEGYIGIDVKNTDFVLTKPNIESKDVTLKYYSFHCTYGGWPRFMQFKYVHELQNFFYALYNEDLIYKFK